MSVDAAPTATVVCEAFDRSYAARPGYFGARPSPWLIRHVGRAGPAGGTALDLGGGDGRNGLHLARRGFRVTSVDLSATAVGALNRRAEAAGLPLLAVCGDAARLPLPAEAYDMALAVTTLSLIEPDRLPAVAERIVRALAPGGLLLVEEFSPDDPGRTGRGPASEFAPLIRSYFAPADLGELFGPLTAVSIGLLGVVDRAHGRPHRHGLVRYVARKAGRGGLPAR